MKAVLMAHHARPEAIDLALTAAQWLSERGHRAFMPWADAKVLRLDAMGSDEPASSADVAISLGGDGTMLRTVAFLDGRPVPIIGVNVGILGYLSEVEPSQLIEALERFVAGDYEVEERMLLQVEVRSSVESPPIRERALNEVVIEKCESGHTVRLIARIDGAVFTSYVADGLIVATPTGSTAYSLSARGPIVSPQHRCVLLTPVSPHMLFDRSLVLDPAETVEIEVDSGKGADVSIDGREFATVPDGSVIVCQAAREVARLVRFSRRDFHQILKAKFGLSDR
jgi:NAD+ kinase